MKLLFYAESSKGAGGRLQRIIEAFVPKRQIDRFKSIEILSQSLCRPRMGDDVGVAVLLAETEEQLARLLEIRDLLEDVRILLVAPNRDKDTVAKAHTLLPRFLTYTDSDFVDIAAVLNKILGDVQVYRRQGDLTKKPAETGLHTRT